MAVKHLSCFQLPSISDGWEKNKIKVDLFGNIEMITTRIPNDSAVRKVHYYQFEIQFHEILSADLTCSFGPNLPRCHEKIKSCTWALTCSVRTDRQSDFHARCAPGRLRASRARPDRIQYLPKSLQKMNKLNQTGSMTKSQTR